MQRAVWIRDLFTAAKNAGRPVISFEFFPPKTEEGERNFFEQTLPQLIALKPDFCSVTYGAGGSTRDKTLTIVEAIQQRHNLPVMAHLTCVGSSEAQLRATVVQARARGISNILALRGDPPPGSKTFEQAEGGFSHAWQLVRLVREMGGFCVAVAGFPEGHPACKEGKLADWKHLKAKIDHGADLVITQLFFDNRDYFAFRDHLVGMGVTVPLVPGILPILSVAQLQRLTQLCGATIPPQLRDPLRQLAGDDNAASEFGIAYATRQCEELLSAGVPGIHFYTLNRLNSTKRILENLGLI